MLTTDALTLALIEGSSFILDQGIPKQEADRFDDVLGRFMVDWVKRKFCEQADIDFVAGAIFLHCGKRVLQRFCLDIAKTNYKTGFDFSRPAAELVIAGYAGHTDCPLLDPYALGSGARSVGWEYKWCPFRNAAQVLWTAGWKNLEETASVVVDARNFLFELHNDLRRRGSLIPSTPLVATRLQ